MAVDVPFRLAGGRHPLILVPARANGFGPFPFVLDTGAGICLLSPDLARRADVATAARETAVGAAGPREVRLGTLDRLAVGEAELSDVPVAITEDLERIGDAIRTRVFGDVGYAFLKHFGVTIDYRRSVLTLEQPGEARSHAEADSVPVRIASEKVPLVLVPAEINGEGPFRFALDTGASTTLLSPEVARVAGVAGQRALAMTGAGGRVAGLSGSVESVRVGPWKSGPLDVAVAPFLTPLSEAVAERLDGILGYNFLRRYRVRIDYPERLLELQRPSAPRLLACADAEAPAGVPDERTA